MSWVYRITGRHCSSQQVFFSSWEETFFLFEQCYSVKADREFFPPLERFQVDSIAIMSLQSVAGGAEDVVEDDCGSSEDGAAGANQRDTTRTVPHHRVELPPYFHGDGKDKKSFCLWLTRLKLAVKAYIATILPTRLSPDILACWLSLPPDVRQGYKKRAAKLNKVFGRKQFLLHFQTFVNARQQLNNVYSSLTFHF